MKTPSPSGGYTGRVELTVIIFWLNVDTYVCYVTLSNPCFFIQEENNMTNDTAGYTEVTGSIKVQKENIIEKSLDKLKETSTVCTLISCS